MSAKGNKFFLSRNKSRPASKQTKKNETTEAVCDA